jgi:acetylornithine aminotransferase
MKNALAMEKVLRRELSQIGEIEQVRGKGLLLGIVLKEKIAQEVLQAAALQGLLVNAPTDSVIRIAPALNISKIQVIEFVKRFKAALNMVTTDE